MKREFLMLAQNYVPEKHLIYGYYVSEKLDGIRCFWDGGITRGISCFEIPWANTNKHNRYLVCQAGGFIKATGLWTRYGQPIMAPDWWLDQLPLMPLDGELYSGNWQRTASIVKSMQPSDQWKDITYWIFDSPPLRVVFEDGAINNGNYKKKLKDIIPWILDKLDIGFHRFNILYPEEPYYKILAKIAKINEPNVKFLEQFQLASTKEQCQEQLEELKVKVKGREGLMLRSPISFWKPERSRNLLKLKFWNDMEGTIVGYRWGKETNLERSISGNATNKLLGLMGSVILKLDSGVIFDLSGFTDSERVMSDLTIIDPEVSKLQAKMIGESNPGEETTIAIINRQFPRGSRITFKYRELSNDGVPKEARYYRKGD